jgi:hypothetical protein
LPRDDQARPAVSVSPLERVLRLARIRVTLPAVRQPRRPQVLDADARGKAHDYEETMHDRHMTRRDWLASVTQGMFAVLVIGRVGWKHENTSPIKITVYKDPNCGCCTKWVDHLRTAGLHPTVQDRSDMDALKDSLGVPKALRSCHTAVAGRYAIEGHVPAADVQRLIATAPRGVVGLAVPQMPVGSPGMESGGRVDRYDVIAFAADGSTKLFARH